MSLLLPFTLAAILTTDPLGYECVPEEQIEAAFSLGGKGMRIPQTCIIDPCKQTFSEMTLASYSGYQDDALYRDYRLRMSSVCGAPSLWDDQGITREQLLWAVFDGGSGRIPLPGSPYLDTAEAAETEASRRYPKDDSSIDRNVGRGGFGSGAGGGRIRSSFTATRPETLPITSPQGLTDTIGKIDENGPAPLPTVPLPAPFFLLAAAALSLAFMKRRRGDADTAP